MNRELYVIAHDMRSTFNVGALLRLCDGLGVSHLYFTGYTPYPAQKDDTRLPHIVKKLQKQINKTALGAENSVSWSYELDIVKLIKKLQSSGIDVIALEQSSNSITIPKYSPKAKTCVILGKEVQGMDSELIDLCDKTIEIPMYGKKESHNVVQAAAMMLYHCRFSPQVV